VTNSLEMLSGRGKSRGKKECAKEAQAAQDETAVTNGAAEEPLDAVVAM